MAEMKGVFMRWEVCQYQSAYWTRSSSQ